MELRTMADVGAWVRSVRKAQGLTQTELAARMGVTQSLVSRMEKGHPRMEAQTLLDAFDALATPLQTGGAGLTLSGAQPDGTADQTATRDNTSKHVSPKAKSPERDDPFNDVFAPLKKKS